MEQIREIVREKALQYAEEAFAQHEEQVFAACDCILACVYEARQSGLLALEEKAESWKGEEGKEIPLRELLLPMVQELVDAPDIASWEEKVYGRVMEKGCLGYEWYITNLYMTGCKQIWQGFAMAQYYQACRGMVPDRWQERFDSIWEAWSEKAEAGKQAHIEEWVEYTFENGAAVRAAFHKRFGELESEGLRQILEELPDKILAAGLAGAEMPIQIRFLEQMTGKQRAHIMAEWYDHREEYGLRDIEKAMERMTMAAGLMGAIGS